MNKRGEWKKRRSGK